MLRRGCIPDIRSGRLDRRDGRLVVTMCWYPRFVRKERISEYTRMLAPDRLLFAEFKARARATGDHNGSFEPVGYESRFDLSPDALRRLDELVEEAERADVYLCCQCDDTRRCHVDMLLMTARHRGARNVEAPRFDYPTWGRRLREGDYGSGVSSPSPGRR